MASSETEHLTLSRRQLIAGAVAVCVVSAAIGSGIALLAKTGPTGPRGAEGPRGPRWVAGARWQQRIRRNARSEAERGRSEAEQANVRAEEACEAAGAFC
jgi:hypothetical protein